MNQRMEEYRAQGYTIFEGLYDETTMQTWRDEQDRLQALATEGPPCARPNPLVRQYARTSTATDVASSGSSGHPRLCRASGGAFRAARQPHLSRLSLHSSGRSRRQGQCLAPRPLGSHAQRRVRTPFGLQCHLLSTGSGRRVRAAQGTARFSCRVHCPNRRRDPQAAPRRAIDLHESRRCGFNPQWPAALGDAQYLGTQALLLQCVLQYLLAQTHGHVHRSQLPTAHRLGSEPDRTIGPCACWVRTSTCRAAPTAVSSSPTKHAGISGLRTTSALWKRPPNGNSPHVDGAAVVDENGNAVVESGGNVLRG